MQTYKEVPVEVVETIQVIVSGQSGQGSLESKEGEFTLLGNSGGLQSDSWDFKFHLHHFLVGRAWMGH